MNTANHSFITSRLVVTMLGLMMLFGGGSKVQASNAPEDAYRYMVNISGVDKLSLEMPLYDQDGYDSWIDKGYVYITIDGGHKETLFYYYSEDMDGDNPYVWCSKGVDGDMKLSRDQNYNTVDVYNSVSKYEVPFVSGTDYSILHLMWSIPDKYRGKMVTISWSIHKCGNGPAGPAGEADKDISINSSTISIPAQPAPVVPQLQQAMLGYDATHAGKVMVLYTMPASTITSLTAHYQEVNGNEVSDRVLELENTMSGFAYLPSNRCYKNFYIDAAYKDSEDKDRTSQSEKMDIAMLHEAAELSASVNADGKVVLSWTVRGRKFDDIMSGDSWEVQRCTSGVPSIGSEWISVGQVGYDQSVNQYTLTDETLLSSYAGKEIRYRVRRSCTALWDWAPDTYASITLPPTLTLPTVVAATTQHTDWNAQKHAVELGFRLGGKAPASQASLLTDSQGRIMIADSIDWKNLAAMVDTLKGKKVDVVMTGDIDLGNCQIKLGRLSNEFSGSFDGNGHTLTVNYGELTKKNDYVAPFEATRDITIKNLHVTGRVTASGHSASGMIGLCSGKANIENSRVSVILADSIEGEAKMGGFIGYAGDETTITGCLFDGQLIGPSCHSNAGFIGWAEKKSTLKKCLFQPAEINTLPDHCRNFVRGDDFLLDECYYSTPYDNDDIAEGYTIIRNDDDWKAYCDQVNSGQTVKDAMLVADINVTTMCGTDDHPWTAKLEGNGHTMTLNIVSESDVEGTYIAPFSEVKGCTIQNLKVNGTIKATHPQVRVSGLVGQLLPQGDPITIRNCHVSVNIDTPSKLTGGILTDHSGSNADIQNSLFDGTVTYNGEDSDVRFGAIIGRYVDNLTTVSNCLEKGTYNKIDELAILFLHNTPQGGDNCWSYNHIEGAGDATALSVEDLVAKLNNTTDPNDFNWEVADGNAVPMVKNASGNYIQGKPIGIMTAVEVATILGDQWTPCGNIALPTLGVDSSDELKTIVWDPRARLTLTIHKKVGDEVRYTERRDVTEKELQAGKMNIDLHTSCVDHTFHLAVSQGTSLLSPLDTVGIDAAKSKADKDFRYYFHNNVQVDSLKAITRQDAVALTWQATGEGDYYRILRRDKELEQTDTIVDNYSLLSYMDRTVRPQHVYEYTVEGITNCEGEQVSRATVDGHCATTGMVRGYVRLADGTALAGRRVTATPTGDIEGAVAKDTLTDESGFFEIGGLIYQGQGTYELTVATTGEEAPYQAMYATFDNDKTNLVTGMVFTQTAYYRFSGLVMYKDTSVPVIGAQFLCDSTVVCSSSGNPIISDSQGRFTVSIPQGTHTVQVVKQGHVFELDGFYTDPDAKGDDKRRHNWQKDISEHVFWDSTRVVLQGRVVGGNVQGEKPLGQSLSVNNLGDSLTIVMQLEGDNTSWLIRDQLDESITESHNSYAFGVKDTCNIDTYRHRLVIHPDKNSGEYCVPMLPVTYKVTEVYAQGYSTLFQSGEVGQTLDLSGMVQGDSAVWNRIYHATPTLDVTQFNMIQGDYFGIKSYASADNTGKNVDIELWNDSTGYSFGHPVFMAGSPVMLILGAEERYYKNNNPYAAAPDIVKLPYGRVHVENGLVANDDTNIVELDSVGQAVYSFMPENVTFTQEGDKALKTLGMTLEYDNAFFDVKPLNGQLLQGYVMASTPKPQGRRVVSDGGTYLLDILRDPPGANSSAYIESGTKMSYSFKQDIKAEAGVKLSFGRGGGNDWFTGVYAGAPGNGSTGGEINSVNTTELGAFPITFTYYNGWQYNYTFETQQRISTGTGQFSVGRDADVFMGMTQNLVVEDAIAVRAIDEDTYDLLTAHQGGTFTVDGVEYKVPLGTMKLLAQGKDSKGKRVYLVRDEVMQTQLKLNSTFVHSQFYIENELIPALVKVRNSLMLPKGTTKEQAQAIADKQGYAAYISTVEVDDENFCGKDYYEKVDPAKGSTTDSIGYINSNILTWIEMLAVNEREKVEVNGNDLVASYDVDGRAPVSYSETFNLSSDEDRYFLIPALQGTNGLSLGNISFMPKSLINNKGALDDEDGNTKNIEVHSFGNRISVQVQIIASLDYNYNYGTSNAKTKTIGFTLEPSLNSNLLVDVYRTHYDKERMDSLYNNLKKAGYSEDDIDMMIFTRPSEDMVDNVKSGTTKDWKVSTMGGLCSYLSTMPTMYRSLVYRTRGGATNKPYEDARYTKYYNAGLPLDEKTLMIDNLRMWTEQPSVSNVPFDEPARFKLYLANESEVPNQSNIYFTICLDDPSNAKGAKVFIDGAPVTGTGTTVMLPHGGIITKEVEVYPTQGYDYENIGLSLFDADDVLRSSDVKLSAHFIPAAGKVSISMPGDKWVVNTESPYNTERQRYYMPVVIDGFDVNYRNFDHIELQYKLSTQGDKDWVNVCSYYNDAELMAKASGVCELIKDDGRITASFYGEADPVEQYYDIRAVNYCRYGNGYLTRSSNILTGVKDTRRPILFGTPKPEDGILDIGEDIMLRFSEPIAGNYLSRLNNFQVLGTLNSSNITLDTDLRFADGSIAVSEAQRNLAGKSFTIDMMLSPDNNQKAMSFFGHGQKDQTLVLGMTADRKMVVALNNDIYTTDNAIDFNGLRALAWVFQADAAQKTTTVTIYDGTTVVGEYTFKKLYEGNGNLCLGNQLYTNLKDYAPYEGEMLEFRLWNRAQTPGEISGYAQKHLTGYELGLLDNFPLNEGRGDYSYNHSPSGGDLQLKGATWKMPDGIGMKLDGEKGFPLESKFFNRDKYQNYTISFWFRTTSTDGTIFGNGESTTEAGFKDHFNFGVRDGLFDLRLSGFHIGTDVEVNDGDWHFAALTVSRSRNVGNLYLDQSLRKTFAVDTLGGVFGNNLAAGAVYHGDSISDAISGNIDEIAMYETVLPESMLGAYANMAPSGEEMGLMAYLSFSRSELQPDNSQRLVPTGISLRRYRDNATGKLTEHYDTIVAQKIIDSIYDKETFAPMKGKNKLENVLYSYVADGKELLLNLDVPDVQLEKTNVIVTVKDVADLNGNLMSSPVVMDIYVYKNPLRWSEKRMNLEVDYGMAQEFKVVVNNLSGKTKNYRLEGLPLWITASKTQGRISALDEEEITFTISPYINIGDYDEVICLVGEDGMSEPLPLNIKVRGEAPEWAVSDDLKGKNITMHIIARIEVDGEVMSDKEDRVAVLGKNHQLLGVANIEVDQADNANNALAFLKVYNSSTAETPLSFELWDASKGRIYSLNPKTSFLTFKADAIVGTTTNPCMLYNTTAEVQRIDLNKGWNWISFYVQPDKAKAETLLNELAQWEPGDALEVVKADGTNTLITYKQKSDSAYWDSGDDLVTINPRQMYRFYVGSSKSLYMAGQPTTARMQIKNGWNRIGYISPLNLPIGTALADYTDQGTSGDIIKSQSEFAVLDIDNDGNRTWKGTLKFMRSGEGYMLRYMGDGDVEFDYPTYNGSIRYVADSSITDGGYLSRRNPLFVNTTGQTMNLIAVVDGVEVEEDDQLVAYMGAEKCGAAVQDDEGRFFLTLGRKESDRITLAIEREGEIVAVAPQTMKYVTDSVTGTLDTPTVINFTTIDRTDDTWYTLQGLRMNKRPTRTGVYLHNGKAVIVGGR